MPLFGSIFLILIIIIMAINNAQSNKDHIYNSINMEDVIASLRDNWETPVDYLKQRGYLNKKRSPNLASLPNAEDHNAPVQHSPKATNILNKQLPSSPNMKYDISINQPDNETQSRVKKKNGHTANNVNYIGENWIKNIKQKWNTLFSGNNSTNSSKSTSNNLETTVTTASIVDTFLANNTEVDDDAKIQRGVAFNSTKVPADISYANVLKKMNESDLDYIRNYISCIKHNKTSIKIADKVNASDKLSKDQYLNEKLQFLANIHHPVDKVGKKQSSGHIDLDKIQQIIDDARYGVSLNEDIEANANQTTLASITLNDSNLNSEMDKYRKQLNATNDDGHTNQTSFSSTYTPVSNTNTSKEITKRSQSEENYFNDYLDSTYNNETEYTDPNILDDGMDAEFFWRHKHHHHHHGRRKHKKKKKRRKGFSWLRHKIFTANDENNNMENNAEIKKSPEKATFSDFNDIKFLIEPNQQEDIVKFIKNVNTAPQAFNFDVDEYILNRPAAAISNKEEDVTEKAFYQFLPEITAEENGSNTLQKDGTNLEKFESGSTVIQRADENRQYKRDLLTQRLKSITNKINMFKPLGVADEGPRHKKENTFISSGYEDKLNLWKPKVEKTDDDDNLINNFYLLNDGSSSIFDNDEKISADKKPAASVFEESKAGSRDLDIDLDLDRKFRDLNMSKNELFYSAELLNETRNSSPSKEKANFQIYT